MKTRLAPSSQRGIALPVMLIILLVMMVSSIYLLKSTNSTTLTTSNLAYDASLGRAADLGLHTGFQWLTATAAANKTAFNADDPAHGYHANFNTLLKTSDSDFWSGSQFLTDADGNRIEYIVYRLCSMPLPYDDPNNACIQTAANTAALGNSTPLGTSMAADAPSFAGTPQVHYMITARIQGARGGTVVNQMVVLIGA